jgi:hypothetical protein
VRDRLFAGAPEFVLQDRAGQLRPEVGGLLRRDGVGRGLAVVGQDGSLLLAKVSAGVRFVSGVEQTNAA